MASQVEQGELRALDIVIVKDLKSEEGKKLNGKKGIILPSDEIKRRTKKGDFDFNPKLALNVNGRYNVQVEMTDESMTIESGPSRYSRVGRLGETKIVRLKRENLELISGSLQTTTPTSVLREIGMRTTAEIEAKEPGIKGIFPAVGNGDHVRLREIMEYLEKKCNSRDVADYCLDGDGNGPLVGAVQHGHLKCVEILLEFGANINVITNPLNPALKDMDISILHWAIFGLFMKQEHAKKNNKVHSFEDHERIIELLLEHGANVNMNSKTKGTPITLLFQAEKHSRYHDSRLRLLRMLLDHGADPNIATPINGGQIEMLPIVDIICMPNVGPMEYRMEIVKLLLDHGADPGQLCKRPGEKANAIHMAASHRIPQLLEVFLQYEKGVKAINMKHIINDPHDGENALQLALSDTNFAKGKSSISRECVIILLKYGGDIHQKRNNGVTAFDWIQEPLEKHIELRELVQKAPMHAKKKATKDYWDPTKNAKVKEFIGSGRGRQCPVCMVWSDVARDFNSRSAGLSSSGFQQCSRCQKQWYCSRDCQKSHWPFHKRTCKEASK